MFEATTNPKAQNAMEEAHRARAATAFWGGAVWHRRSRQPNHIECQRASASLRQPFDYSARTVLDEILSAVCGNCRAVDKGRVIGNQEQNGAGDFFWFA